VSEILRRISEEGEGGPLFAGAALAEGVRAEAFVKKSIMDRLLTSACALGEEHQNSTIYSLRKGENPIALLGAMIGRERAVKSLQTLGMDSTVYFPVRFVAAEVLLVHDRFNEVEQVVTAHCSEISPYLCGQ
jgi:hypothetical protein